MRTDFEDWRDESGLVKKVKFKKKFAFWPKTVKGNRIFLKTYYKKYHLWYSRWKMSGDLPHVDFIEDLTEEDYSIEVLKGNS